MLKIIGRSTFDLKTVLDTLASSAARLSESEMGFILRRDGEVYRIGAATGLTPEFLEDAHRYRQFLDNHPLRPGRATLTGRVAIEGRAVQIADVTADPEYRLSEAFSLGRIRSQLGVPLLREGTLIGVLILSRQIVKPYSEKQIELATTFADQAVIAIENARLLTELRESLDRQTATAEVLGLISRFPGDLEPVFEGLLENATRLCEANFGILYRYDDRAFHVLALRGVPHEFESLRRREPVRPPLDSSFGRIIVTKQASYEEDVRLSAEYLGENRVYRDAVEIGGIRSYLAVPLVRDGELIGASSIYRQEVKPFTPKQIELVENFAAQAVIAIENARLLGELRESLERQTAMADLLAIISRSTFDLRPVFATVAQSSARLCEADRAIIFRYDGELLRMVATFNTAPDFEEWIAQNPIRPGRHSGAARAALERRTVHVPDVLADPEYTYGAKDAETIRTILGVPILKGDELLGVIMIYKLEVNPFAGKHIELVETFADQAAIAIENARLLAELRSRTDELAQRQAELRVTFDNMADGVAMFDSEQLLVSWNRNLQQILDLPDEFFAQPRTFRDYITYLIERGEFGAVDLETELKRYAGIGVVERRFERVRPDGRVLEIRNNPVPGGGFVTIYGDVTERRRAEDQIRTARDAAEKALAELQAAQANLIQAEKMASLGQLTAGIAHEIKNPLNFVNNFAGLSIELLNELTDATQSAIAVLDEDKRAEVHEVVEMLTSDLQKIAEHGRRADGIVKSMLAHSRGGSGDWQSVSINALVEESLNLAYHGARSQDQNFNITLERDYGEEIAPLEVVPQDVTRVFLNLFGNGFYAANKRRAGGGSGFRPALKVTTRGDGENVFIVVRDNGIGIPPEIRAKLFEPFFTTKPTGEGTGLGLSISYEIVTKQHGGTIEVESEPGAFTQFTVRLPRRFGASPQGQERRN